MECPCALPILPILDVVESADYNHERKDEIRDLIEVMKSFTGKTRYELINEHTTLPAEYWNWRKIDWSTSTYLWRRKSRDGRRG